MPKGCCLAEATPNSKKIKLIALAIVTPASWSVTQSGSQSAWDEVLKIHL